MRYFFCFGFFFSFFMFLPLANVVTSLPRAVEARCSLAGR